MHYVIGDVHGCYDEMMELLRQIEEDDENAKVYFVGDLIDRGPKVWETLLWAMEHITPDGNYRCVRGNHEVMVLEWYEKWKRWFERGGAAGSFAREPTTEYDFYRTLAEKNVLYPEKLEFIMNFFRALPYHDLLIVTNTKGETVNYRIAHAWHYYERKIPRELKHYINTNDRTHCSKPIGEIVVHGHTPTVPFSTNDKEYLRPGKIDYEEGGINVDGGCCYHTYFPELPVSLCGICLETLKEYYAIPTW